MHLSDQELMLRYRVESESRSSDVSSIMGGGVFR